MRSRTLNHPRRHEMYQCLVQLTMEVAITWFPPGFTDAHDPALDLGLLPGDFSDAFPDRRH